MEICARGEVAQISAFSYGAKCPISVAKKMNKFFDTFLTIPVRNEKAKNYLTLLILLTLFHTGEINKYLTRDKLSAP